MNGENLTKQNILMTGGTGFAGRYAIKRLVSEGHCVYALVRNKKKLTNVIKQNIIEQYGLKVIEVENPEKLKVMDLKRIIEENEITTILHIAGIRGENRKVSWSEYLEVNVFWTKNLALAFLDAKVNHNKFIFTSTVGVYGTIPQRIPADEETPYDPDGLYHKSKMIAEKELLELELSSDLPLIILRPTIIYGNEDLGFLYKFFRLMRKKVFPLCGSNPRLHLLDVELLADTYAELVKWNYKPSHCIFNVGDREPVDIAKLSEYTSKSMNAGYLKIPSFVFAFLTNLCAFNRQYSVSLKLISKSWFYNVDKLYKTFNFKAVDTIQSLDKKYIGWYKGAGEIG